MLYEAAGPLGRELSVMDRQWGSDSDDDRYDEWTGRQEERQGKRDRRAEVAPSLNVSMACMYSTARHTLHLKKSVYSTVLEHLRSTIRPTIPDK